MTKFEQQVIEAIKSSGKTISEIAEGAGVDRSQLYKFVAGKNITSATLGKILDYLEIRLVIKPPPVPPGSLLEALLRDKGWSPIVKPRPRPQRLPPLDPMLLYDPEEDDDLDPYED